ncbi:hypothetical protein LCGC14_0483860 [marine sediment metagenome]|uniref:Uncharacterized protein n=1 Tax=marine sediment metagenome TaxID=412755 RepID=A0A0F9S8H0_9ZZZZ
MNEDKVANTGNQRMNLAAMGSAGGDPSQVAQPNPPALVDSNTAISRIEALENRANCLEQRCHGLEIIAGRLIAQVGDLRGQLGMPPLPDDHFNA